MAVVSDQSAYSVDLGGPLTKVFSWVNMTDTAMPYYSSRSFGGWVNMTDTSMPYYGHPPFIGVSVVVDATMPYLPKVFQENFKLLNSTYMTKVFASIPITVTTPPRAVGQFWPRGN